MRKVRLVAVALVACGAAIVACSSSDSNHDQTGSTPPIAVAASNDAGANDPLNLPYNPVFDPDYNHLNANPAANHVSDAQRDKVTVTPTTLVFDASDADEVRYWEPGRVIVSEPGSGTGFNPLGFARRVVSVAEANGKVTVTTTTVGLEDLVSGDFQVRFDPKVAKPVDLSKMDLKWVAKNLYHNGGLPVGIPGDPLIDNTPPILNLHSPGGQQGFFDDAVHGLTDLGNDVANAVVSGADTLVNDVESTADTVANDLNNLLPTSFGGSVSIGDDLQGNGNVPLFDALNFSKTINGKGNLPLLFTITGSGSVDTSADFYPGFQVGANIPNYLAPHPDPFTTWINVNAQAFARIHFNADITTTLESADKEAGSDLQAAVNSGSDEAEKILAAQREALFGDPDLKPAGGWSKTLYLSKPSTQTFFAGPVPVVITSTLQVDLACGFEAKATIHADIEAMTQAQFRFTAGYSSATGSTSTTPVFTTQNSKFVNVTGGGEMSVTCGLIPRINTYLYDTVGLNVGVRASVVADASYATTCQPTTTTPAGEVDLGLSLNYGVELGARFQAPGSSEAGVNGEAAGIDVGPIELWNGATTLGSWTFPAPGLGICTPTCKDGTLDSDETDVDCGGGACPACLDQKKCKVNTDCHAPGTCNNGLCKVDTCADRVKDADESDVDCGGVKCPARCAQGNWCEVNSDCVGGTFCDKLSKTCIASSCNDGVQDGTEAGIDCGGPTCGKCALGAACNNSIYCDSGLSDGKFCIANPCTDRKQDGKEAGVDCGSPTLVTCGRCPLGQTCKSDDDCIDGYKSNYCSPQGVCAVNPAPSCFDGVLNEGEGDVDCGGPCAAKCGAGQRCHDSAECADNLCTAGSCQAGQCNDNVKNEGEGDVDCGAVCPAHLCADGKSCNTNKDCASQVCDPDNHVCQVSYTCYDGQKDGGETDADCGGPCPLRCDDGKACKTYLDCQSANCVNNVCGASLGTGTVFVTGATYNAVFGGLAGADAACQAAGDAQGYKAVKWKAWLSDDTTTAAARMTHFGGGYGMFDGTIIARTADQFFGFAHLAPINVTEAGVKLTTTQFVWTGISPSTSTGDWCNDWTKAFGDLPPIGQTDASDSRWTSSPQPSFCDGQYHLYCVQQ